MILLIDFGGQTAHLIARRIREIGAHIKIIEPEKITKHILKSSSGIILSGGPDSVYAKGAPNVSKDIYVSGKPILGICYGFQLMCRDLNGKVIGGQKEYGPATLELQVKSKKSQVSKVPYSSKKILKYFPNNSTVWMSHGDEVTALPPGFVAYGSSKSVKYVLAADEKKKMYGLQFHPEVNHTEYGREILKNFIEICGIKKIIHNLNIEEFIEKIREQVGENHVIGAVSGGVDSTVAATLTAKAIGKRFYPIYVDNGLMRFDTTKHVENVFRHIGSDVLVVNVKKEMLEKIKGISDPEKKKKNYRKILY